jgi:hypothetical protein
MTMRSLLSFLFTATLLPLSCRGLLPVHAARPLAKIVLHDSVAPTETSMDPKEAVKLFGRLAEKYIMLDSSGGMCCYSGCTG